MLIIFFIGEEKLAAIGHDEISQKKIGESASLQKQERCE